MNRKQLISFGLCGLVGASLQGAIIFGDEFSGYTTGVIDGQAGSADVGSYSESWIGDDNMVGAIDNSGSLSYSDGSNNLVTGGGHVTTVSPSLSGFKPSLGFPNASVSTSGSELWISGLMTLGDSNSAYFGFQIGPNTSKDMFGYGLNSSGNALIVEVDGGALTGSYANPTVLATSTGTFSTSAANFFVAKITDKGGPNLGDFIELYVNPNLTTGPGTAVLSVEKTSRVWFPTQDLEYLALSADLNGSASATGTQWDEIRVGTSFADVAPIPEPATFVLLTGFLALGGMILRRRRA